MNKLIFVSCLTAFALTQVNGDCDKGPIPCSNIGTQTVCYDPTCDQGGVGCNAGGEGQDCRFCGFDIYPACPTSAGTTAAPTMQPPGQCVSTNSQNCVQFINNCAQTVWVGILGAPSIPAGGGFQLNTNQQQNLMFDINWSGRFWGRTECDQSGKCVTGDCGGKIQCNGAGGNPPATLAEITFGGYGGIDYYDVSVVDGYNLPMQFAPIAGTFKGAAQNYSCGEANCLANLNANCPTDFQVKDNQNNVVGCMSACDYYGTPQYCCTGQYSSPQTCQATTYANQVKAQCPFAYSYAYDDVKSTFTCQGSQSPSPAYKVTFC